jgi:hypothetical protein
MTEDQFPPRDAFDIAAYDTDECVSGYRGHCTDDIPPGPNHSPSYRWGWTNARKDVTGVPDGFEGLRAAFIELSRRPN